MLKAEVNPRNLPEPEATLRRPAGRADPKTKALTALSHWRHSEHGIPQHFYSGFCLYMSAVQDALLGQMGPPAASVRNFTVS